MSFIENQEQEEKPAFAYPNRVCGGCGRKGGGNPDGGLENVNIELGFEVCGECLREFADALWATRKDSLRGWLENRKKAG